MTTMSGSRTAVTTPRTVVLWLAVALALLAGFLEPPLLLIRRAIHDVPTEGDAQMLWMAPLANLVAFLPVGAVLQVLVRSTRRASVLRAAVIALCTMAIFALLSVFQRLHSIAWLLLAVGASVQLSGLVVDRMDGVHRWTRRTTVGLATAMLLIAGVTSATPALREAWFRRSASHAAEEAPNILLLVLDTVRSKSLSLAGYVRRTTPELEAWAASGVQFTDAMVTSPWTLPSHATMFTGLYPHELAAGFKTPLESGPRTLAEELASHGYATAGFVANRRYGSAEYGLNRGFTRYVDYRVSAPQILISASIWRRILWYRRIQNALGYYDLFGRADAATVNRELIRWIDAVDRPFFAFVNYYDAHEPYLPPVPYDRRFTDRPRERPATLEGASAEVIAQERDMYDGVIAYLDAQLGALRDALAARGLLERTVVIITSDHGEQFGEHGLMGHGNSLYSPLLHVPLVIVHPPSVPAGLVVQESVTLRDLPSTLMDLVSGGAEQSFPGSPLSRFWTDASAATPKSPMLAALTWPDGSIAYAIRRGPLLYIDWFQEREELYDLQRDPSEVHDLAQRADSAFQLRPLRALKDSLVGHVRRPPERGM